MKLNILHLSDLHMSRKSLPYLSKVISGLFQDIKAVGIEFDAKPDLIFLTGDLINKGENADVEFKLASNELIEPLLGSLGLTQDQLFAVPGNHEINRCKVWEEIEIGLDHKLKDPASLTEYYRAAKSNPSGFVSLQEKLASFVDFTNAYSNQFRVHRSFFYDAYIVPFPTIKVGIVGFNTAWRCSQVGADNGRLLIGTDLVDEAAGWIKGCDVKLCLCHHPFEMFAEWNWKPLRRRIAKEFQLLFTGHVHDSEVEYLHQIFGNVFVSTSGSLNSADRFNFYSLVQIDLAKGIVTSFLRKWYDERECFDQEPRKRPRVRCHLVDFALKTKRQPN